MSRLRKSKLILVLALLFAIPAGIIFAPAPTNAVSGADFNPGRIIDDSVFYNSSSMSASQIQTFLNSKVPTCDTNGTQLSEFGGPDLNNDGKVQRWEWAKHNYNQTTFTCLKAYQQDIPQMEAASGLCGAINSANDRTAAQIIKDVSNACGINPQVLIVLLNKEQSLVVDTWPLNIQYNSATGFDCPDSAPCDPQYAGFFYQVYYAARQFKIYKAFPNDYNYIAGRTNNIYWHPDLSRCGSSQVFIQNQATAALYVYTPYRPNQAALDNLYGTGNSCSSYGNRNFWRMFSDWFGSTHDTTRKLQVTLYDAVTDQTGERAKIGYSLIRKPSSNVTIRFNVSSVSNIRIVGNASLTITPATWDKPELNTLIIAGLHNSDVTDIVHAYVVASTPTSSDNYFASLTSSQMEKARITNLPSDSTTVYRLYSSTYRQHRFTSSTDERSSLITQGWASEGTGFYTCRGGASTIVRMSKEGSHETRLADTSSTKYAQYRADGFTLEWPVGAAADNGNVPVYERYDPVLDRTLYTTSASEGLSAGFEDKGIAFYACSSDSKPIYRLYQPEYNKHFITDGESERDKAINQSAYRYENVSFYVCGDGDKNVYRLYRKSSNSHLYTTSVSERNSAVNNHGFVYEGVAFQVCNDSTRDVYRLYRKSSNSHLYTTSVSERNSAVNNHGFVYEGVAFQSL
jgi:hypothetical protein